MGCYACSNNQSIVSSTTSYAEFDKAIKDTIATLKIEDLFMANELLLKLLSFHIFLKHPHQIKRQ